MSKIVFIDTLPNTTRLKWLQLLREALGNEILLLPEEIDDEDVYKIDLAIVANPRPRDLLRYPSLKIVHSVWAGVDKLVSALKSEELSGLKIELVRLVDPKLSVSMAESVLAWTLYLQRHMPEYAHQQATKNWRQLPHINSEQVRVSLLGAGEMALRSLELLKKLDYRLSCWSRKPKQLEGVNHFCGINGLKTMLAQTDILISLLPLTSRTYQLLDKKTLAWLPAGAKLMNFSRGAIINTTDLLRLIDSGHIAHAVLDVFDQEPLPKSSELWTNEKVTVLPHISAPTNKETAVRIVADSIIAYRTKGVLPKCLDLNLEY
ncbi:glyoxylate/hydroxypyruvate reductase A [Glaciecola sp. KUL10]|uniref:2-hydroxyacid dehydrogenase n=1 Tax=Glaciecola sp. (strain KUL10) TaxID=2161813 RepID=UPI000D786EFC|nr:glyoxylate/hydroxypyruvate reductase A [Glaciecola sp. KUL10]GBL04954.1 hypothetical protein KUL10_22720 [Glaciecola sp. KUL10]